MPNRFEGSLNLITVLCGELWISEDEEGYYLHTECNDWGGEITTNKIPAYLYYSLEHFANDGED